jgi:hypothetical protein
MYEKEFDGKKNEDKREQMEKIKWKKERKRNNK